MWFLAVHVPDPVTLLDELNLIIWMAVRSGATSRKSIEQEYGNADVALVGADEVVRASAKRQICLANTVHALISLECMDDNDADAT